VTDLRAQVVAKQLDLDYLKKSMADGAGTPLMFATDKSRHDFWKLMARVKAESEQLKLDKENYMFEKIELEGKLKTQEMLLDDLRKELAKFSGTDIHNFDL